MLKEIACSAVIGLSLLIINPRVMSNNLESRTESVADRNAGMQEFYHLNRSRFIDMLVETVASGESIKQMQPRSKITPSDIGMDYDELSIEAGGIKINGWTIPGKDNSKIIILLHRYGSDMSDMLAYAAWLHENNYSVLMFDSRAHGKSSGDYTSFGKYEAMDLDAIINHLHQAGYLKVGVLGASMGGVAALLSKKADAVVTDSPYAQLEPKFMQGAVDRFGIKLTEDDFNEINNQFIKKIGIDAAKFNIIEEASRIKDKPTFVIYSKKDEFAPFGGYADEFSEKRKCQIAGQKCTVLWALDSDAHNAYLNNLKNEEFAKEYRTKVIEFFKKYL